MLMVFLRKHSWLGQMGHFAPKNNASSSFWIHSNDFLKIYQNKMGRVGNYTFFVETFPIWAKWTNLDLKIAHLITPVETISF